MSWTLCKTAIRCCARRVRAAVLANPLIGALAIIAALTLPLLALVAGRSFSGVVTAARGDDALAFALALALGNAAATGGAALAALAPTRELLGAQLGPSPIAQRDVFIGLLLLPAALAGLPVVLLVLTFAMSAGGLQFAVNVVTSGIAAASVGAGAAEAVLGLARGSRLALVSLGALACACALVGYAAGNLALGPIAPFAAALGGEVAFPLALTMLAGAVALALWALAAVKRPSPRRRRAAVRVAVPLPRGAEFASACATAARLARNAHVRRHVATAIAFAVGGAAAVDVAIGGAGLAGFFAGSVALVAASVLPLVGAALRRDSRWLVRPAPTRRRALAAADACGAVFVGALVVAVVLAAAATLGSLDAGAYVVVSTTAATVLGAAGATGALLPWHPASVVEQLASYALLAVVAGSLAAVVGRAAGAAAALGLSEPAFSAFAAVLVLAGGIGVAAALEE